MPRIFTASDFDFALPAELIAQHPTPERSASRLLDGTGSLATDRIFRDLPSLLPMLQVGSEDNGSAGQKEPKTRDLLQR